MMKKCTEIRLRRLDAQTIARPAGIGDRSDREAQVGRSRQDRRVAVAVDQSTPPFPAVFLARALIHPEKTSQATTMLQER